MPDIKIRGLSEDVVASLKQRAAANGRSMEAELRAMVEQREMEPTRAKFNAFSTGQLEELQHALEYCLETHTYLEDEVCITLKTHIASILMERGEKNER